MTGVGTFKAHAILCDAAKKLAEAGMDTPELDARLLLAAATDYSTARLQSDRSLQVVDNELQLFSSWIGRRLNFEPVYRIIGEIEFYGRPFSVSPDVLLPRQDSETLIDAVLDNVADRQGQFRILDIGTGSGILAVTLACELQNSTVMASDISPDALKVAEANACKNKVSERVSLVHGDLFESVAGQYDIIISNPPYIASRVVPTLGRDVRDHDPLIALDGGDDGLDFYRKIFAGVHPFLRENGRIFLETGFDQGESVTNLAVAAGFPACRIGKDLAGQNRMLIVNGRI